MAVEPQRGSPSAIHIHDLATRYTEAWCSQRAESVAAFYSEDGSLRVNAGEPAVGRVAIAESAQRFMTAFPDMKVTMDGLQIQGDRALYRWTLTGTNSGPGGTGKHVRFSGHEIWRFARDGSIADSTGHFDTAIYERQLKYGVGTT
jgi:steroid delta-isomerase-like uncharacterized protein